MSINPITGAKAIGRMAKKAFSMNANDFLKKYSAPLDVRDEARGLKDIDKNLPEWGKIALLPRYQDEAANTLMRNSMKANGFTDPITVNKSGEIVSGIRRAIIAQELGIPVKYVKVNY